MTPLEITREDIERRLAPLNIDRKAYPLLIVGIRGFSSPLSNKRGVYDDAIIILTDEVCEAFHANTDPSKRGINPKIGKGYASLKPGVYPSYRFDIHNSAVAPHPAICQRAAPVTVQRDGGKEQTDMLGINIHRGGMNGTSSEGCQTLPYSEWSYFYSLARSEAKRLWGDKWKVKTVCYVLLEA